ncbi:MAG: glycosyltransferase [Desulfobacterales bacterium]
MPRHEPLKIMHLINDLGCGGAQKVILNLVRGIDRESFLPIVGLWGKKWGHEMIEYFVGSNIEIVDFQARSKFDLKALSSLYRYLSRNSIDILHTHLFLMHIMGRLTGKCARIPWIVSTHHNLLRSNNLVLRVLEKVTSPLTDVTISVSRAAQETYFSTSEEFSVEALRSGRKHFTIYNSVNIEDIKRATRNVNIGQTRRELGLRDEFVFACVGRLHPSKGHQYLIEAVDHLRDTHPFIRLLIVGDGPLQKELIEEAQVRELGKQIYFLGYRDDVYRILAAGNALVQPSIFEGFGLASAEAMACGLPVISTNLPSIAEVVQHEKTGILVPPGDSQALAKAMATFVDNPALAATYGANGKQRVEEMFSSQAIMQQYEDLYETLVELS